MLFNDAALPEANLSKRNGGIIPSSSGQIDLSATFSLTLADESPAAYLDANFASLPAALQTAATAASQAAAYGVHYANQFARATIASAVAAGTIVVTVAEH